MPPTSICSQYFAKANEAFQTGFNAAGFAAVVDGIVCLYKNKLLTEEDLLLAILRIMETVETDEPKKEKHKNDK